MIVRVRDRDQRIYAHTHSQGSAQCSTQLFFGDFRRCGTQFFAKLNLNSSPFFVLLSLMLTWWLFIGVSFWRIIFRGPRIVFNAWIKRQSSSTHSFSFMGIIHHYIGELGELMFANVCTIVLCCIQFMVNNSLSISLTRISVYKSRQQQQQPHQKEEKRNEKKLFRMIVWWQATDKKKNNKNTNN